MDPEASEIVASESSRRLCQAMEVAARIEAQRVRCDAQVRAYVATQQDMKRAMEAMLTVVNESRAMVASWQAHHSQWRATMPQLGQQLAEAAAATESAKATLVDKARACRASVEDGNRCCGECCGQSGACSKCWRGLYWNDDDDDMGGCEHCGHSGVCQGCVDLE